MSLPASSVTAPNASSHGTPVYMTVWSLLPPSFLSNTAFNLGCGILHTNVYLPDINTEFAFGGHDVPGVTGIFSLPRDGPQYEDGTSHQSPYKIPSPGPPPIADCHYVGAWFLGYAGAPSPSTSSSAAQDSSSSAAPWSETGRFAAPQRGFKAFREPGHFEAFDGPAPDGDLASQIGQMASGTLEKLGSWFGGGSSSSSASRDQNGSEDPSSRHSLVAGLREEREAAAQAAVKGEEARREAKVAQRHPRHSGARARSIAFAMRTIQELKSSSDFHGPSYDLLQRNCNHFSSRLVSLLVGCELPAFVNRAAGLGAKVAPYLPPGVLEIDTALEEGGDDDEGEGEWEEEDRGRKDVGISEARQK